MCLHVETLLVKDAVRFWYRLVVDISISISRHRECSMLNVFRGYMSPCNLKHIVCLSSLLLAQKPRGKLVLMKIESINFVQIRQYGVHIEF